MNVQAQDAFENAEKLYDQYAKLAKLGELAVLADREYSQRSIIASVSPVLCQSYQNALLG